jgi:hypothetical protein
MSACCEARDERQMIRFGRLARHVLSLDSAIEWLALEEAGREPRWAWRDQESGDVCAGSATGSAQVADPLLFMLAESGDGPKGEQMTGNPHSLRFVVLAYADVLQIVARLRPNAHVTVAAAPGVDPYVLGTKLTSLLDLYAQTPALCYRHGNVPA